MSVLRLSKLDDLPSFAPSRAERTIRAVIRSHWVVTAVIVIGVTSAWCREPNSSDARYELCSVRGRVVWLSSALARRYGIQEVPEAKERVLALEDRDGNLHPLVEDIRGRAFRLDPRLREMDIELLARRYTGSPFLQIVRVFEHQKDGRFELDYWCDICSIAMFELKDCECCQGPIELRRQPAPEEGVPKPQ